MVKNIVRDPMFLMQKSEPATEADKQIITDLMDTLRANLDVCVGMVDYLDQDFKKQHGKYSGFTAQIIQHEIQHFSGELI